jgi:soluble P-type ATPase
MIELDIPGRGNFKFEYLVLDVNGTLAKDGRLLDRLPKVLANLRDRFTIYLLTANTYGKQDSIDQMLGLRSTRLLPGGEDHQKANFVHNLGPEKVIAIGQGANDAEMLKVAALGIAVMSEEGLAIEALLNANIVAANIYEALNLLEFPSRIVATLRR